MAAEFTSTKGGRGFLGNANWCMYRASTDLPVPDSPMMMIGSPISVVA
jgi:hypothetical protein